MNITFNIENSVVEAAREVAIKKGTSLNALVRSYLEVLSGESKAHTAAATLRALWAEDSGHSNGWSFNRAELYDDNSRLR